MATRIRCVGEMIESAHRRHHAPRPARLDPDDIRGNKSMLRFLNDKDRDILYLIFVSKKNQVAVSRIMNRTQPCIVYDVRRIKERIRFIAYLHDTFDILVDFLETRASEYDQRMIDVLLLMYYTTSYSLVGNLIRQGQPFVRTTFLKALRRMREMRHWDVYELFSVIMRNKNKIKRLSRKTRSPGNA